MSILAALIRYGVFPVARRKLAADRTYYVRTDGSDLNDGLADSAARAFLTIQKAIDVACALDLGACAVTIQVAAGTYTGANVLRNYLGRGPITIQGDTATPANCVVSVTGGNCFDATGVRGKWVVKGFKLQTTTSGSCLVAASGSYLEHANLDFGACANNHISATQAFINGTSAYTISGGAQGHMITAAQGAIRQTGGVTVTLSGTPAFSAAFFRGFGGVIDVRSVTFSGSATGLRCALVNGAFLANLSAVGMPGDTPGTIESGSRVATLGNGRAARGVYAGGTTTGLATDDIVVLRNLGTPGAQTYQLVDPLLYGQTVTIKDGNGDAATYNITILPQAGSNIDLGSSTVISTNFGVKTLYYSGLGWSVVG